MTWWGMGLHRWSPTVSLPPAALPGDFASIAAAVSPEAQELEVQSFGQVVCTWGSQSDGEGF